MYCVHQGGSSGLDNPHVTRIDFAKIYFVTDWVTAVVAIYAVVIIVFAGLRLNALTCGRRKYERGVLKDVEIEQNRWEQMEEDAQGESGSLLGRFCWGLRYYCCCCCCKTNGPPHRQGEHTSMLGESIRVIRRSTSSTTTTAAMTTTTTEEVKLALAPNRCWEVMKALAKASMRWVKDVMICWDVHVQAGSPYFYHYETATVCASLLLQANQLDLLGRTGLNENALYLFAVVLFLKGSLPTLLTLPFGYHKVRSRCSMVVVVVVVVVVVCVANTRLPPKLAYPTHPLLHPIRPSSVPPFLVYLPLPPAVRSLHGPGHHGLALLRIVCPHVVLWDLHQPEEHNQWGQVGFPWEARRPQRRPSRDAIRYRECVSKQRIRGTGSSDSARCVDHSCSRVPALYSSYAQLEYTYAFSLTRSH